MRPMRQGRRVQCMNDRYPQIVQMPSTDAAGLPVIPSTVIPRFVAAPNKAVKSFACGSLGRSALRICSRMAPPFLRDQLLHAERRLPWR